MKSSKLFNKTNCNILKHRHIWQSHSLVTTGGNGW